MAAEHDQDRGMTPLERDREVIGNDPAIGKLRAFSDTAVSLQAGGFRTDGSTQIMIGGFSMPFSRRLVERILQAKASPTDILTDPSIAESLGYHSRQAELELLERLLPTGHREVLGLPIEELDHLIDLQDRESSRRFQTLEAEYMAAGRANGFKGSLRWGVVDSVNLFNRPTDNGRDISRVDGTIMLATELPHVRYALGFQIEMLDRHGSITQSLVLDPRVAMMPRGFAEWYQTVRQR